MEYRVKKDGEKKGDRGERRNIGVRRKTEEREAGFTKEKEGRRERREGRKRRQKKDGEKTGKMRKGR
jgi:hypothetical protein